MRLVLLLCLLVTATLAAAPKAKPSPPFSAVPLMDLGAGIYKGCCGGGLYENGLNTPPADHAALGETAAAAVQPINGAVVLLSIGMSNTSNEWCGYGDSIDWPACLPESFTAKAYGDVRKRADVQIVNGAQPGKDAPYWLDPFGATYQGVQSRLAARGYTEAQVQVVWVKQANANPSGTLPNDGDADLLASRLATILRSLHVRYPNLRQAFVSSRIYAGYAGTNGLSPEPYAYENGWSVQWVVADQIAQERGQTATYGNLVTDAPWAAWGPYLWASGAMPRSDGLTWVTSDYKSDKTHPSLAGIEKVGNLLLGFFATSPLTTWFRF